MDHSFIQLAFRKYDNNYQLLNVHCELGIVLIPMCIIFLSPHNSAAASPVQLLEEDIDSEGS